MGTIIVRLAAGGAAVCLLALSAGPAQGERSLKMEKSPMPLPALDRNAPAVTAKATFALG